MAEVWRVHLALSSSNLVLDSRFMKRESCVMVRLKSRLADPFWLISAIFLVLMLVKVISLRP